MQFATLKNLIRTSPTTYHSLSTTDPEKPPSTSPPAPSKPLLPRPLLFALLAILSLPTVVLLTFLSLTFFTHPIPASSPPTHPHDPTAVYPHLSDPRTRAQLLSPLKWNYSTPSPCGHTPHAAQRAGCVFGPTTWAWYPPACYDFALEAEFLRLADWGWYSSEDLADKHRLDREEVLRGEHKVAWMGTGE
ncbi:hypothetical protein MMC17_008642 [Xylographa soralifera]|nr:hypothetical protein [Xylographa soralifera]